MQIKSVQVVGRIWIEGQVVDGVITAGTKGIKLIETVRMGQEKETATEVVCLHHENGALVCIPLGMCIVTVFPPEPVVVPDVQQAAPEQLPEPTILEATPDALPTADEVHAEASPVEAA